MDASAAWYSAWSRRASTRCHSQPSQKRAPCAARRADCPRRAGSAGAFSTRTLWPDQPLADGEAHEAGDVADLKLGHDSAPVGVDARRLYADRRRDFLARPAVHDELQDLAFARTEPAQRSCFHILLFIAAESGNDSRDRRQCLS